MFTKPEKNILQLGIREGITVADLGSGTGFYSIALSKRVGYSGKVYAVEVQKDLVKKLEQELVDLHISNVVCIWGDIEKKGGTKIMDHSIDAVVLSNILFQVDDKIGLIDESKRILKKGGEILLVDWNESFGGIGPIKKNITIGQKEAKELFEKRGLQFVKNISTSEHHYGIIFKYESR
jgi:ubiquinone/menaquinone biosynthesis C-methylase UbiE